MTICDKALFAIKPYLIATFEIIEAVSINIRFCPLFFKVWIKTGVRPIRVGYRETWREGQESFSIEFRDKFLYYWCYPISNGHWIIQHFDLTIIENSDLFLRRNVLLSKYLPMPQAPDMWESINYCVQAISITKKYENEEITQTDIENAEANCTPLGFL